MISYQYDEAINEWLSKFTINKYELEYSKGKLYPQYFIPHQLNTPLNIF